MWKKFLDFLFIKNHQRNFKTVRVAFPVVVIATILASLASLTTESSSYVSISSKYSTVTRDQEFFVDVSVGAHVPINAIDLVISYSEDMLEVIGIDTGTSVITLWAENPYAENGKVYLRGGTFRKGFIGQHEIAHIKLRAKESGIARFFVSNSELVAGDGKGTPVPSSESSERNEIRIAVLGEDGVISGEATVSLVTDIDGDRDVDLVDISKFMTAWFTQQNTYDFNNDGRMTFKDFSILLSATFNN